MLAFTLFIFSFFISVFFFASQFAWLSCFYGNGKFSIHFSFICLQCPEMSLPFVGVQFLFFSIAAVVVISGQPVCLPFAKHDFFCLCTFYIVHNFIFIFCCVLSLSNGNKRVSSFNILFFKMML